MKKIAITAGVIAILSLGSCTKDWTCTCTDQNNVHTYHTINDATLTQAKNTCNGFQIGNNGNGVYTNCSIQ